jgi:hypothetical protein
MHNTKPTFISPVVKAAETLLSSLIQREKACPLFDICAWISALGRILVGSVAHASGFSAPHNSHIAAAEQDAKLGNGHWEQV